MAMCSSRSPARVVGNLASAAFLALAALGCGSGGPERFGLGGQVIFDGQPIPEGDIAFRPAAGTKGPSVAGLIVNGAYSIPADKGPVAGSYAVTITAERKTGRQVKTELVGDAMGDVYEQYVPERYNARTELKADVTESRDDLNFDLSSKKK
jgi:hypothetical protein